MSAGYPIGFANRLELRAVRLHLARVEVAPRFSTKSCAKPSATIWRWATFALWAALLFKEIAQFDWSVRGLIDAVGYLKEV